MTLPGGFRLPIALVVEESRWHDSEPVVVDQSEISPLLSEHAEQYLHQQMIAGSIRHRYEIVTALDGAYYQIGKYACYEMIGMSHPEEDLARHEINGTNGERGAS